ncbi:regulator of microtubule dynamics protein 3 [Scleropages formosus]|uniref:Regulator of microtubule dynamics protein 3 n=1 Tax=Scleropages formosus TaxID=113540 RepID=A0A8C9S457_SCLFO|nr:regulator of microtubule dynamics protein 3 [Scleropages formosus]
MNTMGRHAWIGLGVGATAGSVLLVYFIYRERRRRSRRVGMMMRENEPASAPGSGPAQLELHVCDSVSGTTVPRLAAGRVLQPEQGGELQRRLDEVLQCVADLRGEVAELRVGLQSIAVQIVHDVKEGLEESQKAARRRRHLLPRERTDSLSSSSIYFTASGVSLYDGESEGGYTTANAESDYNGDTDRETDKEHEVVSEDDEDRSCATVRTLRQDSQEEDEEDASLLLESDLLNEELEHLLSQGDILHAGGSQERAEGFQLLLDNKAKFGEHKEFLWRLARAYSDMYESTRDAEEKKSYAEQGREEAEAALQKDSLSAEGHKWFAILTGLTSHSETMHSKLKSSHIFKEHIDKAISLKPDNPQCFYLLGRWCYEVSSLGWLEKKAAAALFETPPTATVQDALENFLKAEQLSPGFSRIGRLYIAKCHKDLGNISEAKKWTELASAMPRVPCEDAESAPLEEALADL